MPSFFWPLQATGVLQHTDIHADKDQYTLKGGGVLPKR